MLMTAVVQPEVFDRHHFATPGYRDQAEMMFRGFQSNGLLILDPNARLLKEIEDRIRLLSTKDGQQLQIRLEEIHKSGRKRFVIADRTACPCPTSLTLLETAKMVHSKVHADTLIVDDVSEAALLTDGYPPNCLTLLSRYIPSDFERRRHECLDEMPPINEMEPVEFDHHITQVVRFSTMLRFYDKQIGKGGNINGFREGIGRILKLWTANAHFPHSKLSVEIYTCFHKTHEASDVVYKRLLDSLVRRLVADNLVPITLHLKNDPQSITHDRFLQTDSVPVLFGKGFDFINNDGTLQSCAVKIDNGAYGHLYEYRTLMDFKPPQQITP